jgi:hypothetical protein
MSGTENNQPEIVLSDAERATLGTLAGGEPPFGQRAKAILAVADGADLAAAGASADLTENQVRHWLGRFRNGRLAIFPEVPLPAAESAESLEPEPTLLAAPPESPKLQAPPKVEELTAGTADAGDVIELPATTAVAGATAVAVAASKKSKKKDKAKKKKKATKKAKNAKKDGKKKVSKKDKKNKNGKKSDKKKQGKKGNKGKNKSGKKSSKKK